MGIWKALEKCPLSIKFVGLYKPQRGRVSPSDIKMYITGMHVKWQETFKTIYLTCRCVYVCVCVRGQ